MSVDPKYQNPYSTHIPAVILAVNNNPMRFTDRKRRRVTSPGDYPLPGADSPGGARPAAQG
ncbi:hypothetical protein IE981_13755 [Klebsiella pneumoniae]|nr:hypothetical protein [Klebsiella pneumoniae]